MNPVAEQVRGIVGPAVQAAGWQLLAVKQTFDHGRQNLTIYIDTPGRPVSVADCIKVSKLISPLIEQAGVMRGAYFLNVSSPKRKS